MACCSSKNCRNSYCHLRWTPPKTWAWSVSGGAVSCCPSPSALGKKKSCKVCWKWEVRVTASGMTLNSRCSFTGMPATVWGPESVGVLTARQYRYIDIHTQSPLPAFFFFACWKKKLAVETGYEATGIHIQDGVTCMYVLGVFVFP